MPLFGPNIKKMREANDVAGLIQLLVHKDAKIRSEAGKALSELRSIDELAQKVSNSDNPELRVSAAHVLKDIGDKAAIEALVNAFSTIFQFGEWEDQVEAMMVIQGRISTSLVHYAFLDDRRKALKNVHGSLELPHVQNILEKVVNETESSFSKWYALLTLVELGDRREEVLQVLISFSESYTKAIDSRLYSGRSPSEDPIFLIANETNCLIEETVRALAAFRGSALAKDTLMLVLNGEALHGTYVYPNYDYPYLHPNHRENAICALGALGDPTTRERLEYLASRGYKCAEVALENFGVASYDEIKAYLKRT